ncbi:2-dehydropantoate 2-reductase [Bacillus shivajii]|uniref:2-dehydropantoate 2-reductase n=1 Tax=Bacillus shivajii TaxID=1983719 RepID=UPI001CFB6CDE|nr:2-dehydropantoate 2-reductase [Bacillus shivajii]UCZ51837.1 2-dehydropantoate 2-reductase [Bacillus shivajii]
MKILVIGAGSVGLLIASYLQQDGHEVSIVTRSKRQADTILEKGLKVIKEGEEVVQPIRAIPASQLGSLTYDLAIITLKQTHLEEFFHNFLPVLKRSAALLFLQNGMGHMEKAASLCANPLYAGVVTHGAMKTNDRVVRHTGDGEIAFGPWGHGEKLYGLTDGKSRLCFTYTPFIKERMVEKLIINFIVNPLTALYGVRNGELLEDPFIRNVQALFNEVQSVLEVNESHYDKLVRVIKQTKENESSMYQDIKHKRRTEIDAITGYILKMGRKEGIRMPLTEFLHYSIKGIERSWGDV